MAFNSCFLPTHFSSCYLATYYYISGIWSLWYNTFDDLEDAEKEQKASLPSTAAGAIKVIFIHIVLY